MIYQEDVNFFLDSFDTNLEEISHIWQQNGGFMPMVDLAKAIISQKGFSPDAESAMLGIVDRAFPKDFRSGAFERQNFFYGLADYYAETHDEPTVLVEFDLGNCSGTGDYVGDEDLHKILRYMRHVFEQTLAEHEASYVEAFDNAKNDDLKLVVTGLDSEQLADALESAQLKIMRKFIFATDIPHSKYDDERNGIGVGSGFIKLGKGRPPQTLQNRLNLFVEKRKLEDTQIRHEIRKDTEPMPMTREILRGFLSLAFNNEDSVKPVPEKEFPYDLSNVKHITDPFKAREEVSEQMANDVGMSGQERETFSKLLNFYHSSEGLTGARRGNFLFDDMKWIEARADHPITVLNVKVENCAGLNKVLSHVHSAEMTRHFVDVLSDFTRRNFGDDTSDFIYYIGRNSFNVLVPSDESEAVAGIFREYLQQDVDQHINDIECGEYFAKLGLTVPDDLGSTKMGDIKNLRGLEPGVLAINIEAKSSTDFQTESELLRFQNMCLASHRAAIGSYTIELPEGITYRELEQQAGSPRKLLEALKKMASDIVIKEGVEEQDNNMTGSQDVSLEHFIRQTEQSKYSFG